MISLYGCLPDIAAKLPSAKSWLNAYNSGSTPEGGDLLLHTIVEYEEISRSGNVIVKKTVLKDNGEGVDEEEKTITGS